MRAVIGLAQLGIAVTAEGVELAVQEAFLRTAGCDDAQGYYYSRPLALQEFIDFTPAASAPRALVG